MWYDLCSVCYLHHLNLLTLSSGSLYLERNLSSAVSCKSRKSGYLEWIDYQYYTIYIIMQSTWHASTRLCYRTVLGAIQGKLLALQESARNFKVPEDMRQNFSVNLANARDFIGLNQSTALPDVSASDTTRDLRPDGSATSSAGTPQSRYPMALSVLIECLLHALMMCTWWNMGTIGATTLFQDKDLS